MSIFPEGTNPHKLVYAFDIAAFELPIPSNLTTEVHQHEWRSYTDLLSPARMINKFGAALDMMLAESARDFTALSDDEKRETYSHFKAANTLAASLQNRVLFYAQNMPTLSDGHPFFAGCVEGVAYLVKDLMKGVNAPDAQKWEERYIACKAIDTAPLYKLVNDIEGPCQEKLKKGSSPPPTHTA